MLLKIYHTKKNNLDEKRLNLSGTTNLSDFPPNFSGFPPKLWTLLVQITSYMENIDNIHCK